MSTLSIKTRLYLLSIIPLLFLAAGMMTETYLKMTELNDSQIKMVRTHMLEMQRNTLHAYVEIVDSTISPLKEKGASVDEVVEALSKVKYGKSGYFFGYTSDGIRVFSGESSNGVGDSFWSSQDSNGNRFVQSIIKDAKSGKGFTSYYFPKAGQTTPLEKMSFSVYESQWDLIIGTGFYLDDVDETVGKMSAMTKAQTEDGFTTIVIIGVLTVFLSAILAFLVSRTILKPLHQFDSSIADFANGQGDLTARIDQFSVPEFAKLSDNFNIFVSNLQSIIKNVTHVSVDIGEETTNMRGRADRVDSLSAQQREETEQVATAMTEMTSTAQEISSNAVSAAEAAHIADDKAQEAVSTVDTAVVSVESLAKLITDAAISMGKLESNVENISTSLNVIEEIAEQTNLLALNAAIEAARAGEQGRGFAVVADEVRQLASRTQQSTRDISDVIDVLKVSTTEAVKAMNNSNSQSEVTVEQATQAGSALQEILAAVSTIMDMNALIATATEEQSQVGMEISERVVIISDTSSETADVANMNRKASGELNSKAKDLSSLVSQFVV
ncbi:methyl-accepting chemotaxis protein [Vibrio sp. MACH09]|uniref:methyl-accepting chemotaxis protein n=1 Tax=Vibrio sp. MACH09 TaxID=3025122 RepID=UPI00278D1F9A|nr:methyl-accepting chemotaxis protein [Vibrio sp. MACH09]GLO62988.1 methyl-accepting chemotaxis protein [Vibrio sp. MACH09]